MIKVIGNTNIMVVVRWIARLATGAHYHRKEKGHGGLFEQPSETSGPP
jgi:hypothetical protein